MLYFFGNFPQQKERGWFCHNQFLPIASNTGFVIIFLANLLKYLFKQITFSHIFLMQIYLVKRIILQFYDLKDKIYLLSAV